jgi:hypothetical protein
MVLVDSTPYARTVPQLEKKNTADQPDRQTAKRITAIMEPSRDERASVQCCHSLRAGWPRDRRHGAALQAA